MSLRAKRGNRMLYRAAMLPCDCLVVPPRNDMVYYLTYYNNNLSLSHRR